jgi:uncharacterized protein
MRMHNAIGKYQDPQDGDIVSASALLQKEIEDVDTYQEQIDNANDEYLRRLYIHMRDERRSHVDILTAWLCKSREIFEKKLFQHN